MKRSAPKDGYEFEAKGNYRRWVWQFIGGQLADGTTHTGDVLLMPSVEGCEIRDEALPRGFSANQLHVVDESPAIVATIQRKFPGVNTYGCLVDVACARMSERDIKLIAANIDYCGQISAKLLRSIKSVAESKACQDARLFVNVLRGREEAYLTSVMQGHTDNNTTRAIRYVLNRENNCWAGEVEPTEMDFWRITALRNVIKRKWFEVHAYVSVNGQSFLTVGFHPATYKPDPEDDRLTALASMNNGDAGEALPSRLRNEEARTYKARLTEPQATRLMLIARHMDIGEIHLINQYIRPHADP